MNEEAGSQFSVQSETPWREGGFGFIDDGVLRINKDGVVFQGKRRLTRIVAATPFVPVAVLGLVLLFRWGDWFYFVGNLPLFAGGPGHGGELLVLIFLPMVFCIPPLVLLAGFLAARLCIRLLENRICSPVVVVLDPNTLREVRRTQETVQFVACSANGFRNERFRIRALSDHWAEFLEVDLNRAAVQRR